MGKALLVVIVAVMTIYTFYDVLATPRGTARRMPRLVWGIIVFVPVVGPLLWLILGKPRRRSSPPPRGRRPVRPSAPDDDPDFLRDLNRKPEDALEEWEKEYRRRRRSRDDDGRDR